MASTPLRRGMFQPSQVSLKTVFTVCFGVLLVTALVAFVLKTTVALTLTVAALMLSMALDHLVTKLERRGMRRGLAIAAVMAGCVLVLAGLALLLIPPVVGQVTKLVEGWPALMRKLRHSEAWVWAEQHLHVTRSIAKAEQNAGGLVSGAAPGVLVAFRSVLSLIAAGVSITFLTLLMLIFGRELVQASFAETVPQRRDRYVRVTRNIYRSVGGYLGGLLVICSINAVCTTTFLAITHEPYFLALGVMSGLSSMIPYAGPFVAGVTISSVAWASGGAWRMVATAIYFVLYGQLEGNVVAPIVFRRTAHVNPLVTVVAILFFAELAGVFGAIVAVPVAAAGQIIIGELFAIRRERLAALSEPPEPVEEEEHPPPH